MEQTPSFSIFGDSILKGVRWDEQSNRYCIGDALDLDSIASAHGWHLDNRSRFGCTVEKGAALLRRYLTTTPHCDAVLLEYGGNDADFHWEQISRDPYSEHLPKTPLPLFADTLRALVRRLSSEGIRPFLMTLPPISSERYLNWITRNGLSRENLLLWLGDANAIYRYQERYSDAILKIAAEEHCPCIDVRSAFLSRRVLLPYLCADGIHPNEQGQLLLHQTLQEAAAAYLHAAAGGTR